MKLDEFIKQYDDTYVEVGGSANALNQCVDLANAYIMEVLGREPIFGTNAKDFWTRADDSYARISPDGFPEAGDLVIWNISSVGHIAVATGIVNNGKFQTFSQNYPLGSFCHLVDFNMNNLIGYLRPTGGIMNPDDLYYVLNPVWRRLHGMAIPDESSLRKDCQNIANNYKNWAMDGLMVGWVKESGLILPKDCKCPPCPVCPKCPEPEPCVCPEPPPCPSCPPTQADKMTKWELFKKLLGI